MENIKTKEASTQDVDVTEKKVIDKEIAEMKELLDGKVD